MKPPAERILYGDAGPDGRTPYWRTPTLWAAAKHKPPVSVAVSSLDILDAVVWFGGPEEIEPTVRRVAERAKDIFAADLAYPIIMTRSGDILDGAHRIARAYLQGLASIDAVILEDWPEPDGYCTDTQTIHGNAKSP
jgi:hypothetical protein